MNIEYYDLYYSVIQNIHKKEILEDKIDYDKKHLNDNIIMPN